MRDLLPKGYRRGLVWSLFLLVTASCLVYLWRQELAPNWQSFLWWLWALYLCHLVLVVVLVRRLSHPIRQLEHQVQRLRQGKYNQDYVQQAVPIYNRLGRDLTALGQGIEALTAKASKQKSQLDLLLLELTVGVLCLDRAGQVTLASQSMQDFFPDKPLLDQTWLKINKSAELNRLLEKTLATKTSQRQEITLYQSNQRRIEVTASPVLDGDDLVQVLLLFVDVSHLRRLEQAGKDFVNNASHELKTPVTAIKGFAETLLLGTQEDPDMRAKFLQIILQESQRLQDITENILALASVEEAQLPAAEPIDLAQLVDELVQPLLPQMTAKSLTFFVRSDLSAPYLSDRGSLSQILLNLLTNAMRYTDNGGAIEIALSETPSEVLIAIRDTGIGIAEQELDRIFERFYRVNKGRSRQSGGTGLGLSIVARLLERLKGRITVDSQVGQGSCFTIYLPK